MTQPINILDENFYQDLNISECLDWDYSDAMKRVYDLMFGAIISLGITIYIVIRFIQDLRFSSWQQMALYGSVAAFGLFLSVRFISTIIFRMRASRNPLVQVQKTTIREIKHPSNKRGNKIIVVDKSLPDKGQEMEMPKSLESAKVGDAIYVFYIKERKEIIRLALEHQWRAALQQKRIEVVS